MLITVFAKPHMPKPLLAKARFCQNLNFPRTVWAKTTGSAKKRSFECELPYIQRVRVAAEALPLLATPA